MKYADALKVYETVMGDAAAAIVTAMTTRAGSNNVGLYDAITTGRSKDGRIAVAECDGCVHIAFRRRQCPR